MEDAGAFVARGRALSGGEARLPNVLMAMAWLPTELLDAGGREVLRDVCASPALVPDKAFGALVEDEVARDALGPVVRATNAKPKSKEGATKAVRTETAASLVPFLAPDLATALEQLWLRPLRAAKKKATR